MFEVSAQEVRQFACITQKNSALAQLNLIRECKNSMRLARHGVALRTAALQFSATAVSPRP
jgi:hypothetical protein